MWSEVGRRGLILAGLLAMAAAAGAGEIPAAERQSGYAQMSSVTRAMQDDDAANPGMLWVLEGAAWWRARMGAEGRACAECHGDAEQSMRGVAARYPAFDAGRDRPVDLEQRVNLCREERQKAPALAYDDKVLLALTALIARQSRGLPIVSDDPRLAPTIAAGRALFERRQGQLDLSCAQCHDDNWGKKLAGANLPQGQPNGYPLYRLEWQSLGSLQRRLRNCFAGMRAEGYPLGASELVQLETFLMWRARGLAMESPAVRP